MNRFLKELFRFSIAGLVALLLLVIGYFYFDPFKVLYSYDYSKPSDVAGNRDFISTENYLQKKDKYHYNSFIFGSSRTLGYDPVTWKRYLEKGASPYSYDATMESIYGIYRKVRFLDSTGADIRNALLIICTDYTFASSENPTDHQLIKHPAISGQSKFDFQYTFFKTYFNFNFLFSFYTHCITGKKWAFMNEYINAKRIAYDPVNNHMKLLDDEALLRRNPAVYYEENRHKFFFVKDSKGILVQDIILPEKESVETKDKIDPEMLKMLHEIMRIFQKHHTNYEVILHPLLDKKKFSHKDQKVLSQVFGTHLHDFTGLNQYTQSYKVYYDWSHCRPFIGDSILKKVYSL